MIKNFVNKKIGEKFSNPPPFKLSDMYEDTDERTPIIFILSKGADPSDTIKDLARLLEKDKNIRELSLGSGSEDKAVQAIQKGASEGSWCILCNCHLFEDWLPNLQIQCDRLKDANTKVNKDYRLFLTARPCSRFPIPILQSGTKIAYEPPKGLKKNILGSLIKINEETLDEKITQNLLDFKKLMFGSIFLHGVILERKKFGPLGFNKMYDFNDTDLTASIDFLLDLCNRDKIPFDSIEYMIGEITYGGRVTEELDFRTLRCTLRTFLNQEMVYNNEYKFSQSGI